MPSLRTASAADAAAVRELTRLAYAAWIPVIGREPRPMTADYEAAVRNHRIDLHVENGRLGALIEMALAEDHLLIVKIAVHPELHGQGLGRRLLAHAEAVAAEAGLSELRLYTNVKMTRNRRIYAQAGYAETRREDEAVHMAKRLSG